MKSGIGRQAAVAFLSIFMAGCSSIRARNEIPDQDWTVYPGVQQDVKEMGQLFSSERPEPAWVKGLITSLLIVDLPFSTVFDTVVAPYDLYLIYNPKAEASDSPQDLGPDS